jgi:hypothetical protein
MISSNAEDGQAPMDMTGSNGIFVVPAEHFPGLIALIATPLVLVAGVMLVRWRMRTGSAWAQRVSYCVGGLSLQAKVAVVAMTMGATVHAAVVPTHWADDRVLAILFVLDTLGFLAATTWAILSWRHWQLVSAAMLGGTVAGYAFYLAKGWETADPVGMAVSLIELAGFLVLVLAGHSAFADPARRRRLMASSFGAAAAFIAGMVAATGTVAGTGSAALASSQPHGGSAMGAMGAGTSKTAHSDSTMSGMGSTPGPSTTTMPGMGTSGSSSNASSAAMPGMGSSSGSGGGMAGMSSSGTPTTSSMPGMGPTTASSGNSGAGMGGMSGMGGGGSGATPLSLATTSPAGNIAWPLTMGAMGAGMQMVTPSCTTEPTSQQQSAAVSFVDQTVAALTPFENLATAKAAGYVPITPSGATVVHYANPAYLNSPQTLDPGAIESLVYANTPRGAILVAAMYAMANNQVGQMPPMPGGCLTEWHVHTNLCFSNTTGVVVGVERSGTCAAGSTNHVTQPMIHVWLAPIPGGPLAVDASDAQVVAAAAQLPAPNPPNPTA